MAITNWASKDGHFRRPESQFRNSIGDKDFPAEKDRYHLYVSYACPWAHRVLIVRKLKGLEEFLPVTVVHWEMLEGGWRFLKDGEQAGNDIEKDPLYNSQFIKDLYFKAKPDYEGRFTVPTIWDKKQETIVNNESSEIIRFLNTAFDDLVEPKYKGVTYYPEDLRSKIDELNEWVYNTVNNGVYKCGFASTQEAYEAALFPLFESLNRLEKQLSETSGGYLFGDKLTEADIRLFTTIVRFDVVYVQHFKTNLGTIRHNYPHLNRWLKKLYWNDAAFKDTTNFEHIKKHYTKSHTQINPTKITPVGPLPHVEPEDGGDVILKVGNIKLDHLVPETEGSRTHTLKHPEPNPE
ncbi:S-glutathionyl-(chloro)hydroquinone reductase [Savitreella phatthalungensis]